MLGGVIGASFDIASTKAIAKIAKKLLLQFH